MTSKDNSGYFRTLSPEFSICPILKQHSKINRIGHKGVLVMFVGFLLVLSMVNFASAITGKIGNARAVLYPEVGLFGITIERTILVINDNDVPINIKLEADANSSFIKIVDKEFTLEPGEERDAAIEIKLKKAGNYEGRVNIFFTPLDGKGAGVVLSSTLIIHATSTNEDTGNADDPSDSENVDENGNPVTGNVILDNLKDKKNLPIIIASISTLVLGVLLISLLVFNKKRKVNKKRVNDRSR